MIHLRCVLTLLTADSHIPLKFWDKIPLNILGEIKIRDHPLSHLLLQKLIQLPQLTTSTNKVGAMVTPHQRRITPPRDKAAVVTNPYNPYIYIHCLQLAMAVVNVGIVFIQGCSTLAIQHGYTGHE